MFRKARFYRKMRRKYSMSSIEFKKFKIECEKEMLVDIKMIESNSDFRLDDSFCWRNSPDGVWFWIDIDDRCKK